MVDVKSLQDFVDLFLADEKAQNMVEDRDTICRGVKSELLNKDDFYEDNPKEFNKLISQLRKKNAIRNNRFANQINTQERIEGIIDVMKSTTFQEAALKASKIKGAGMDCLTMMLHIANPLKFHCVNGQTIYVIDQLMKENLLPKMQLHKYMSHTNRGVKGLKATYEDYSKILDRIQEMGNMTKGQTDFFMGWLDRRMRDEYNLGNINLPGI